MSETIREVIIGANRYRQERYAHDSNLSRPLFCCHAAALRGLGLAHSRVHVLSALNSDMAKALDGCRAVGGDPAEYRFARWHDGGWDVEAFTESGVEKFRIEPPTIPRTPPNLWLRPEQWGRIRGVA